MTAAAAVTLSDRIGSALRTLVLQLVAPLRYHGTYEYSVASSDGKTCTGEPTDPSQGLPPMAQWPIRGGVAGETVQPTPSSTCEVIFVNGDPGRPEVVRIVGPPLTATLDATAEVNIGPSSPMVKLGTLPAPLATAASVEAIAAALLAFATTLQAPGPTPPASTDPAIPPAAATLQSAITALASPPLLIPTTTVLAGP